MNTQPLVSVVIASYNHANYVEESILSVVNQTYKNIELLVVDDGSSDDSVERIRRLQAIHGFDFQVQENKGLATTLNEAIARTRGEFVAPFGSDDVMKPGRIETQVAYMVVRPEVGICAGDIETIDGDGNPVTRRRHARTFRRLAFDDVFFGTVAGAPAPTLLFRRSALDDVGGFDPSVRLEDLLIELKITRAGYFIDVLSDVLAQYREHGRNTYKNRRFMIDNVMKTYAFFADHPGYERACSKFLKSMLLKVSREDKALARELLGRIPFRHWDSKVLRALAYMLFSS